MTRAEVPTLTDDLLDLPYRLAIDDLSGERWEITAEEDERIARAARPNLVTRALAGEVEAMDDLVKLHLKLWQRERRTVRDGRGNDRRHDSGGG